MRKDKNIKNNNVIVKIINLNLVNCIKSSNLYINKIYSIIEIYKKQIDLLEMNRPFAFQKNKINKYNKEIEEYKNKILSLYQKISEEIDYMNEIDTIIKS